MQNIGVKGQATGAISEATKFDGDLMRDAVWLIKQMKEKKINSNWSMKIVLSMVL